MVDWTTARRHGICAVPQTEKRNRNQSNRAFCRGPQTNKPGNARAPNAFGAMSKTSHGAIRLRQAYGGRAALTAVPGTHGVEYRIWGGADQGISDACMVFVGNYFLPVFCRVIF
jgi:hypothetical protein